MQSFTIMKKRLNAYQEEQRETEDKFATQVASMKAAPHNILAHNAQMSLLQSAALLKELEPWNLSCS